MENAALLLPQVTSAFDQAMVAALDETLSRPEVLRQCEELGVRPDEIRERLLSEASDLMAAVAPEMAELNSVRRAQKRLEDRARALARPDASETDTVAPPPDPASSGRRARSRRRMGAESPTSNLTNKVRQSEEWKRLDSRAARVEEPLVTSLAEQYIAPQLRRVLNDARQRGSSLDELYRGTLDEVDTSALRKHVNEDLFVRTRRLADLGNLLVRMPSGSVGIAGSRGIGKSTALDHLERLLPEESRSLKIFQVRVSAPTEYVPREFLMHLLGEIARTWLRFKVPEDTVPRPETESPRARAVTATLAALLPVLLFVAGAWNVGSYVVDARLSEPAAAVPVALSLATVALGALAGLVVGERLRRAWSLIVRDEGVGSAALSGLKGLSPAPRTTRVIVVVGAVSAAVAGALLLAYAYWLADSTSLEELAAWMLLLLSAAVVLVVVTTIDLNLFRASSAPAVIAGVTTGVGVVAAGLQGLGLLVLRSFELDAQLVLGSGLCAAAACCAALRGGGLARPARELAVSRSAVDLARADLRRLQYQRSSSSGWTTGVKMGASGTIPFEASEQATQSQTDVEAMLTTPEIIRLVRNLLEAIHRDLATEVGSEEQVRVFVGIDELDKLESDSGARDFLNEIKGVFNIPGVIFLVSVSEDALAAFERRGLAFRDAFDSAFDEIVHLPQLSLIETSEILKRKVSGPLPRPFVALGHCLSGGLARDLVRTVDRMVETEAPRSLCRVTEAAIHRELRGKWQAAVTALRPLPLEPHVTDLIKVLYQIDRCPDGRCVPERCLLREDAFRGVYDLRLPPPSDSELSHLRTLLRLSGEYLGFAYFCLTLSQFFVDVEDDARIRQIQGAEQADQHERNGLDYLARARQHLGVNPRLGWEQISYFRAAHGLEPVMTFPDLLLGTVQTSVGETAEQEADSAVPVPPV